MGKRLEKRKNSMKQIKILLTGSAGFIYSNFAKYITSNFPQYKIIGVDKLLFQHSKHNLFEHPNYKFYLNDFSSEHEINEIFRIERPDWVIHAGAMSNVSDSIGSALPFTQSNIVGTQVMIDAALKYNIEKFLFVSTDEVGGHLTSKSDKSWDEEIPLKSRNPYSASKAAGELLVKAAHETHKLPYLITRCGNNFGPQQSYKNLVVQILISAMTNDTVKIHGDGSNIRDWVWVLDNCKAVIDILEKSSPNQIYNIGSGDEMSNLEITNYIYELMGKKPNIQFVEQRKGHDWRYSLDCDKLKSLGWKPSGTFETNMIKTIQWYQDNKHLYGIK